MLKILIDLLVMGKFLGQKWQNHNFGDKTVLKSKKISNDQELIQSDPTSCPQNQKGNN